MATDQDFLAAIYAAPDDDSPRLIYADWLDEQGGAANAARAEFIRVQCELEPLRSHGHGRDNPHGGDCPECLLAARLERRERWLWNPIPCPPGYPCQWFHLDNWAIHCLARELVVEWEPPWTEALSRTVIRTKVRRGFIAEAELSLSNWTIYGRQLRQAAPLHTVCLTSSPLAHPDARGYDRMVREMYFLLRRLVCDDEPSDNPVCGLDTLDLSRVDVTYWMLRDTMEQAYRPWRGLRNLILPSWSDLREQYRGYEIEQWKQRVPSLQSVQFGRTQVPTEGHDASTTML